MAAPAEEQARASADRDIPPRSRRGLIIFLNGASSSGKSSIAAELRRILDRSHFHMPVDAFHAMRSDQDIPPERLQAEVDRTAMGFHRAVAGMAASGNDVVVDHVLSRRWRLLDCLDLFTPEDVVLVGVHCPLRELERREQARGDRTPGLAAAQFGQVHAHGVYDVECDTGASSPLECARKIKDVVLQRPRPTAFERLRAALRDDGPPA